MSENTVEETAPAKPRMSKRERRILEDQTTYIRSVKRLRKTEKELKLAKGAQERATARLEAAQEKTDRYVADRDEALAMLNATNADVPEVPAEEGDESDAEETEAVLSDPETVAAIDEAQAEEASDLDEYADHRV